MKGILLFILLASSQIVSFSQNALFLPFGQSNQQIENYLVTRDYIQEIKREKQDQIVNQVTENRKVVYHFEENFLYATEDIRMITDKKLLDDALKSCREYMKDGDKLPKALSSKNFQKHYLIVKEDKIIELTLKKDSRTKDYILCLKVTSRRYGPRMATEKIAIKFS